MAVGKRSSERALQKVLGKGANVNEANPLEVHDPKVGSLISYEGTTTADGAGDGSSLIDTVLATKPDYNGNLVIITSGAYAGQASDINGATIGGTVTAHTAFDGQILTGTKFVIVGIRTVPAEVAALTALVTNILLDTQVRRIASGSKTLGTGVTKYLHIDSGTNGAEILAIIIKGVVSADWTLDVYVPAEDAAGATAAGDKRDTIPYVNTDTEGGLLSPFAIAYDCYLDFTNDSGGDDNIDVIVMYRSRGTLTLTWET